VTTMWRASGILIAAFVVVAIIGSARAGAADREICDASADLALEFEDYQAAIELHRNILHAHPKDALAHYHLGFAYGMAGNREKEIGEYRTAAAMGLNQWDLFLNLGLAYYEQQGWPAATAAFERAVQLGPDQSQAHLNLALAYDKGHRLSEALLEVTASRYLAPGCIDAINTNAVICAEMGNVLCARDLWAALVQTVPEYAPARTNLAILTESWVENRPSNSSAITGNSPSHVLVESNSSLQ